MICGAWRRYFRSSGTALIPRNRAAGFERVSEDETTPWRFKYDRFEFTIKKDDSGDGGLPWGLYNPRGLHSLPRALIENPLRLETSHERGATLRLSCYPVMSVDRNSKKSATALKRAVGHTPLEWGFSPLPNGPGRNPGRKTGAPSFVPPFKGGVKPELLSRP